MADPSLPEFGEEIPAEIIADSASFVTPPAGGAESFTQGFALIDGCWIWCQAVRPKQLAEWRVELPSNHGYDTRVIGDRRDRSSLGAAEAHTAAHASRVWTGTDTSPCRSACASRS